MSEIENDEENRTLFCGNLPESVTEAILYELFLQAGPLQRVHIPKDKNGGQRGFGFVTYSHAVSVQYAIKLFFGTRLFNREITIKQSNGNSNNNHQQHQQRAIQQQQQQQQQHQYLQHLIHQQQQQPLPQSNPFQPMHSNSLTSGFNQTPYPKMNNMLPTDRHNSIKKQSSNLFASQLADIQALLSMGSNMLQTGSSQNLDNHNSSRNKSRFDNNRPYSPSSSNRQRSPPPPSQSLTSNRLRHNQQRSHHHSHHSHQHHQQNNDNNRSSSRNNDNDRNRNNSGGGGGRDSGHRRNRR